jgi:hypothetical protein
VDQIRTVLQTDNELKSFFQAARKIMRTKGMAAFYQV